MISWADEAGASIADAQLDANEEALASFLMVHINRDGEFVKFLLLARARRN